MIPAQQEKSSDRVAVDQYRRWRLLKIWYLVAALVYTGVIIYWGRYDMSRIHRDFRNVSVRLSGDYALNTAGNEVAAGCRQSAGSEGTPGYFECLRSSAPLVEKRAAVISRELKQEKSRVTRKLIIFYTSLVLLLILLPVSILFGFLAIFFHLFAVVKFEKDQS